MELRLDGVLVFGPVAEERTEKMRSLTTDFSYAEKRFIAALKSPRPEIDRALRFAKSLDFTNSSLKSSYLSHPLRVATFLVKLDHEGKDDVVSAALLHNVLETTTLKIGDVPFSAETRTLIESLTVDRKKPFPEIEEPYYARLQTIGSSALLIKLLDKMDNLFTLCLNPNEPIRTAYTAEIRRRLLPFASSYKPELGAYLSALLDDADHKGFDPELKKTLENYQRTQESNT